MKSIKYRMLLGLFRVLPVKKIMASPKEKAQKVFRKGYKGENIPKLQDKELDISTVRINGCGVLCFRHKKPCKRAGIYLVGGGMLKYPKPSQAKEVQKLAKECGLDMMLPYYPVVFTGASIPDVYEMLYELYKYALKDYAAENIVLMGGSSGGNLALGLISYINSREEKLPLPGKVYAGSPGTLYLTDEEKTLAYKQEKTDVIMSVKALDNIMDGMTGGRDLSGFEYMKYLQLGDYTGLKDVYMSFGGEEVFLAGADSIKKRLEQFGVHVTVEIGEGLYHSYAMMPLVKEAKEGYRHFLDYIRG